MEREKERQERLIPSTKGGQIEGEGERRGYSFIFSRLNAIVRELITELGHRTPRRSLDRASALRDEFRMCVPGSSRERKGDRRAVQALSRNHEEGIRPRDCSARPYTLSSP